MVEPNPPFSHPTSPASRSVTYGDGVAHRVAGSRPLAAAGQGRLLPISLSTRGTRPVVGAPVLTPCDNESAAG